MADEIQRVNGSALFDPRLTPHRGSKLPEELHLYADNVKLRISEWEGRLRTYKVEWSRQGTEGLVFLIEIVQEKTGKSRLQEITDLLTEAARVLRLSVKYDVDAIKMRSNRFAKVKGRRSPAAQ